VAEEAAVTAEFLANRVERLYDVGVAGLHRLLSRLDTLMQAKVIVVCGRDGGRAGEPSSARARGMSVIAVPTGVGYGANFGGLSPCSPCSTPAPGTLSVVNIDNGFGAGYLASLINHIGRCRVRLYLECNMGAAGDMLMGALLDSCPTGKLFLQRMRDSGCRASRSAANA
jgi:NCAIR mutase (PurE)-related protein